MNKQAIVGVEKTLGAQVLAQLVEQALPTPQNLGSNPATSNFCKEQLFTVNCIPRKDENKERGRGMYHLKTTFLDTTELGQRFFLNKCSNPGLFVYFLFFSNTNRRLLRDSNSDRQSRRQPN